MQNIKHLISISTLLVLLAMQTLVVTYASVTINGVSKLSLSGKASEAQKQQQIDLALYDGIVYYYQKNNPEYLEFVLSEIPKDIIVSKVHQFIESYKLLPSTGSKQTLSTEVRARFDKDNFENRVEAFSPTSNNEGLSSSTIVAVEFVRLHSESKQKIDIQGLTSALPVASELSAANYRVLTNYAELSKYTNGRFNAESLAREYASTSQVNANAINTAAESRAGFADAFSVVVLHEVSLVDVQEMLDIEYIVNTNSKVLVYNAISSELVETININNTREIAKNLKTAAQLGINKNSKRIAQQIKGYLFKNNVK
ncbi:MAG: hypothetical protein ACJAW1_002882 [Glaciecola sp.]|jgi:hypothetical protein